MIKEYIKAGYPVIWTETHEPERFISNESQNCNGHAPYVWDMVRGFRKLAEGEGYQSCDAFDVVAQAVGTDQSVWFLVNYHLSLADNPAVIQLLRNAIPTLKGKGVCLVIVAPVVMVPVELDRDVIVLDYNLPDRDDLGRILDDLVEASGITPANRDEVLDAAAGLTANEAENAMALALVRNKAFEAMTILELKGQMVKKSAALEFSRFSETFENLGGLGNLKAWTLNRFKSRRPGLPFRGVLLLGVPGTGKSHFAKALGNTVGWPVLSLEMGRVFGELVGESERKMRDALKVVDRMAPCILFIDEIEKGLAGVGGGANDGGTTERVGGTFLQWLNDHQSEVFVVATCNKYEKLPPEYTRMGRWDAIFFVDNPDKAERRDIMKIYMRQFLGEEFTDSVPWPQVPDLDGYSGAEIRQVMIEAAYNGGDLKAAAQFVIPQSKSQKAQMDTLREWAKYRTIPASAPEVEARTKRRLSV